MKTIIIIPIIFFLVLSTNLIFAQKPGQEKIDSLLVELEITKDETIKADILIEVAKQNFYHGNYESALDQTQEALLLSQRVQYKNGIAKSYNIIAAVYDYRGNYLEALKHYTASLKVYEETENQIGISGAYNNIGTVYYNQGNYTEALNSLLASLKINEKIGDKSGIAQSIVNIGSIYYAQGNYNEALERGQKALSISKEIGDKFSIADSYMGVGLAHEKLGNFNESLNNFQESLKMFSELGHKRGLARLYNNIGIVYKEQGNYTESLKNYTESLTIKKEIGDKQGEAVTCINIGGIYHHMGRVKESKEWYQKSLKLSKEVGSPFYIRNAYLSLSILDSSLGDFQGAYEHYKLYTLYKDSLFNEESTRKLTQSEMTYEFEKQEEITRIENEKEIALRDARIHAGQREKWFLASGLFGFFILGSMLFRQNRIRKKNNQKLQLLNSELDEANRTKTRFFSILNHDLRSPVSNLIHFLHLKKENSDILDEETKERLEQKSIEGAENLLTTMEDLLLWSKGQMESFKPEFILVKVEDIFADLKTYSSINSHITFTFDNSENLELQTDVNYIKTIARNLTSNAIKALHNTPYPTISWKAYNENGQMVLSITDNGPGADAEKFRALYDEGHVVGIKTGLGMHLIRDLAKAIHCKIEIHSLKESGTEISLKI